MKLLLEINRKEFRSWSGQQLTIERVEEGGFKLVMQGQDSSIGALVDQDEAAKIATTVLEIVSIGSHKAVTLKMDMSLKLENPAGESLVIQYVNDGEPFREGVRIALAVDQRWDLGESLDFEQYEARSIASFLTTVKR